MHMKNLRSVDLNLLVILDAVLSEGAVTKAAARLHLSQPAVSHALDRLRSLFGDPLLERRGQSMALTTKAESLRPRLRSLVGGIGELLTLPQTPLRELDQVIRLALADYPAAILLPRLWKRLRDVAPGIRLVCHDWREGSRELERLGRGDIDIALSMLSEAPDEIRRTLIGTEHYVAIARPRHPIGPRPTLRGFCEYAHVLVSAIGAQVSPYDSQLAERGVTRRVGISVDSFLSVPSIVAHSDALALIPGSLARHWPAAAALMQFRPPVEPLPFDVHVAYHARRDTDLGIQTVAKMLTEECRAALEAAEARRHSPARKGAGAGKRTASAR